MSFWRFIKGILGFGPSESERKAIDLCSEGRNKLASKSELNDVYQPIAIESGDSELQAQVKAERDALIGFISKIYSPNDMHPWVRFFLNSVKNQKFKFKTSANDFMHHFYVKHLQQLKQDFESLPLLKTRQEDALQRLDRVMQSTISSLASGNAQIEADYRAENLTTERSDSVGKSYRSILQGLREVFNDCRSEIENFPRTVTEDFMLDIQNYITKKLNPGIYGVLYRSRLNLELGFMSNQFELDFGKVFDLLLTLNMIPNGPMNNGQDIRFQFLNLDNYKSKSKARLQVI